MMYILTQEEYDKLLQAKAIRSKSENEKLQKLCTQIADTMPIRWLWGEGKNVPTPWGCLLTASSNGDEWYCDQCPVRTICPNDRKSFSK